MNNTLTFRSARESDAALVFFFIRQLAAHVNKLDEVIATEDVIREWLFEKQKAEVIFAVADGKEIGFALFFYNISTFSGQAGLFLEDLFVLPEYRGKGYGKGLLRELARIATERGMGKVEWYCLHWNQPSIDFYQSLGAQALDEWKVYRLSGEALTRLAEESTKR